MAQTQMVREPRTAPLNAKVVETDTLGNRWVVAAFDLDEDAEAFAAVKSAFSKGATYEAIPSPVAPEVRVLRRPASVTAELAERDA